MKWNEVFCNTFQSIGREIGLDVQMVEGYLTCMPLDPDDPRYSTDFILPSMKMVEACRADDFDFFRPWIEAGKITIEQMHRACQRYHLGKTKSGQTRRQYDLDITVDTTLEDHATASQKERGIDLLEFLQDSLSDSA